jgi:ectoine hydroxylase-related dioxygenase (phytanoyl-CoA dioxygenase family)
MKDKKEELKLNGFTVLDGIIPHGQLVSMNQAFSKIIKKYEQEFDSNVINENEKGTVRCILALDDAFMHLLNVRPVVKLAREFMGTFNHYSFTGLYTSRDFEHPTTMFHRDFPEFVSEAVFSMNIIYVLDDTTSQNGATWIVPGSHLIKERPSDDYIDKHKIQVTAKAGSVILFNSLTYHAAGINHSGEQRKSVTNLFRRTFLKSQFQWEEALSPETNSKLSGEEKRLLGYENGPAKSIESYHAEGVKRRAEREKKGVKTRQGIEVEQRERS